MNFLIILFVLISTLSWADVTGVKRIVDLTRNTSPNVLDETYCADKSDTSGNAAGTDKKCRVSDLFKAADITVDGTNTGVGVTSPTQKLDVSGTVKATAFVGDGSGLTGVAASASDAAYSAAWDGDTTGIASKNALYDKFETIGSGTGGWTDGTNIVYPSVLTDNIGIGTSLDIDAKLKIIGGGIAAEPVGKGWENTHLVPTESLASGITFSEVNSFGIYKNKLYIGYDLDGGTNANFIPIYTWDGSSYSFHSYLGGDNTEGVTFIKEYNGKLYAGQQGVAVGDGDVWVLDETDTGSELLFNGYNAYISIPTSSVNNSIFGSSSFSIEWKGKINAEGFSQNGRLLDKTLSTTSLNGYRLYTDSSKRVSFSVDEGGTQKTTTTSTTISYGVDTHIVVTWASGSAPKIYINGAEASYSTSTAITTPRDDTANNLILGNRYAGATDRAYNGFMRKLRIYRNIELTSGNVTTLYGGGTVSGVNAEYLFTDGSGTTLTDSSGNSNNGTISNAKWNTGHWVKSFENTDSYFAYSAEIFKGKLVVGSGYLSPIKIHAFDGTTWTTPYTLAGTGLVFGMKAYKGRLFIGTSNTTAKIVSTNDANLVDWNVEASYATTVYSGITGFQEFRGRLYAFVEKGSAGTLDVLVRDDSTSTWSVVTTLSSGIFGLGAAVYNDVLYVGVTVSSTVGAIIYKSYDGVNFELDTQTHSTTSSDDWEAFKMIKYNGSLYVGMGSSGAIGGSLWRKTDSLGQQFDKVGKVVDKFRFTGTSNLYKTINDESKLSVSVPVSFDYGILSGINWQYITGDITLANWTSLAPYLQRGAINWADANIYTGGPTGNIGINNGSPSAKLEVTGTVKATAFIGDGSGLTGISGSGTVNSGTADRVAIYDTAGTAVTSSSVITDNNTNIGIGSISPGTKLDVTGTVRATAFSGDGSALTGISGGSGGWTTDSSTKTTTTYNVGVGSINPTQALDINGVAKASSFQASSSVAGLLQVFEKASNGTDYINWSVPDSITTSYGVKWPAAPGTAGQIPMIANSNNDLNWSSIPSSGSSQWTTTNTNDVYLPNNGNVGLGTSSTTTAALSVMNGNVGIGTWKPQASLQISSGTVPTFRGNYLGTTNGFLYEDSASPDATPFVIDSTGNVGIGTLASASGKLSIYQSGDTNSDGIYLINSGRSGAIRLWVDVSNNMRLDNSSTAANPIFLNGGGGTSAGNVGIGTFTTNGLLTVSSKATKNMFIVEDDGVGDTSPFIIKSDGNVGVGSATPGAMLDVSDDIRSNKGGSVGVGACWCTTPPKVLGYCTGALGTCSACNYNGSGC